MDTGLNDCRREAYREVGRTVFGTAKGMQGREITNIDIKKRGVLMCTAATYKTKDFYFGRTLDYEFSYGEEIVIMPRNYPKRTASTMLLSARRMWRTDTRCFMMRSTKKV